MELEYTHHFEDAVVGVGTDTSVTLTGAATFTVGALGVLTDVGTSTLIVGTLKELRDGVGMTVLVS